ncbi:MAG: hypothetical protein ACI95C_001746 [Pseudohongiellaceae bacterium]|jgi:hypothetical protein
MNWDAISAIGEILGAVAVLATLIYLATQIRQNTEQVRLNSIQAVNSSNDSAFEPIYIPENSAIFSKGQNSYSSLTDHEKLVFHMLMARLIGSFDSTTYQYLQGSYDKDLYWGTAAFYSSFIKSPGGAEWWKEAEIPFSSACVNNLDNPAPKN